jgi:hypothetical protein
MMVAITAGVAEGRAISTGIPVAVSFGWTVAVTSGSGGWVVSMLAVGTGEGGWLVIAAGWQLARGQPRARNRRSKDCFITTNPFNT